MPQTNNSTLPTECISCKEGSCITFVSLISFTQIQGVYLRKILVLVGFALLIALGFSALVARDLGRGAPALLVVAIDAAAAERALVAFDSARSTVRLFDGRQVS